VTRRKNPSRAHHPPTARHGACVQAMLQHSCSCIGAESVTSSRFCVMLYLIYKYKLCSHMLTPCCGLDNAVPCYQTHCC
jgi:hypothetical protein